jgi:excisionase family DNA binding protein
MATAFTALRVALQLNQCTMKHDLIQLAEQYPGLTISVSLEDLLTAGRTLADELLDNLVQTHEELPAPSKDEEELLTKEEARKKLGVSVTTLWRWAQDGYLTPVKVGIQVRYRISDINAILVKKGGAL